MKEGAILIISERERVWRDRYTYVYELVCEDTM